METTSHETRSQRQNSTPPPSSSSTAVRLWRPAAQRNLRNQWSELNTLRQDWRSAASAARSHATTIVNAYLSQKYMDRMDFGVLSDMPNIRKKACSKLLKQQELYRGKLMLSYRDMVAVVTRMVNSSKSMRCYIRGTSSSPLAQFSFSSEGDSDSGDCGGIPVFTFSSISSFEELAWEIVQMFTSELKVKRLLVMELLAIYDEKVTQVTELHWSDEFYDGEFNELSMLSLYSEETRQPVLPCLKNCKSSTSILQYKQQQDSDVLQVYITTWLVEVNIDRCRYNHPSNLTFHTLNCEARDMTCIISLNKVIAFMLSRIVTETIRAMKLIQILRHLGWQKMDEIFAIVGGEMHVDFLGTFG